MENKYKRVSTVGFSKRYAIKCYPQGFQIWFRSCVQGAMRRGLEFRLTARQAYELSQGHCHYCNRQGVNMTDGFTYVGIDRIDNDMGYLYDNVVSCCKTCNAMKRKMGSKEFVAHIKRIASNV